MRRAILAFGVAASFGAGAVAVANALPGAARTARAVRAAPSSPAPAMTGRFETVPVTHWWLLEAGPRARSLVIEYPQGDGCSYPATATVRESAAAVRIALRQRIYVPGPGEGCTLELKITRLTVMLQSPIAGRHVVQPRRARSRSAPTAPLLYLSRWVPDPPYSDIALPLVPRVIGLSPADATRVLRQEGFGAVIHGHGAAITAQSPGRGQLAPGTSPAHPYAGVVELFAGSARR